MNRFIVRSSVLLLSSVLSAFSMEKSEFPQFEKKILEIEKNIYINQCDLVSVLDNPHRERDSLDLRDTLCTLSNKNEGLVRNRIKIKEELKEFVSNTKNYTKPENIQLEMYSNLISMAMDAVALDLSQETTKKEFNEFFIGTLKKNSFQLALLWLTNKNNESIREKIVLGIIVNYFMDKNINGHGMEAMVIENGFAEHKDINFKKNADKVGEYLKINFQFEKAIINAIKELKNNIYKLESDNRTDLLLKNNDDLKGVSEYINAIKLQKRSEQIEEFREKISQYEQQITDNHDSALSSLNHGSHVAGIVSEMARGVRIIPAPSSVIFSVEQKKLYTENKSKYELQKILTQRLRREEKPLDRMIERMDENYKKMSEEYNSLEFGEEDYERKMSFYFEFYKDIIRLAEAIDGLYSKNSRHFLRPRHEETIKVELGFALQKNEFSMRDMLDKYEGAKHSYTWQKKSPYQKCLSTPSLHPIIVSHPLRGRVISCSVALEDTNSDLLYQLCDKGKLCFYAAGNEGAFLSEGTTQSCKEGKDVYTRTDLKDHLILVGNYDAEQGVIADSSNLPGKEFMDRFIYASGTDIESSVICSDSYKQEIKPKTGTSMSAPHAAGITVLLDKYFPDASGGQIRDALLNAATPLMDPQYGDISGKGLVNGLAAAQSLLIQLDKGYTKPYTEDETIEFLFKNFPEVSFKKALEIAKAVSPIKNRAFQRIRMINESYDHIMEKISHVEKALKADDSDGKDLKDNIDKIVLDRYDPASKYLSQRIYDWLKPL